jgi:hypothetical protein
VGSDENLGRSRRPGAEDWGWSSTGRVLGGWMIGRLGVIVCSLYHAQGDEEHGFLGSASKPRSTVSPDLALKPAATVLVVWPQNHSLGFPGLCLKTDSCGFCNLAHKITATVSWFGPQNKVGGGLSVCTSKPMNG